MKTAFYRRVGRKRSIFQAIVCKDGCAIFRTTDCRSKSSTQEYRSAAGRVASVVSRCRLPASRSERRLPTHSTSHKDLGQENPHILIGREIPPQPSQPSRTARVPGSDREVTAAGENARRGRSGRFQTGTRRPAWRHQTLRSRCEASYPRRFRPSMASRCGTESR